jgi:hypothetical protein
MSLYTRLHALQLHETPRPTLTGSIYTNCAFFSKSAPFGHSPFGLSANADPSHQQSIGNGAKKGG